MDAITFGVLTISDTCYQEPAKDRSGPRLVTLIRDSFDNAQVIASVLPDERDLIQRELRKWIDRTDVRIIITTGGTGFAPRDVTPEATKPLIDKDCTQLTLAIALASLQKTKFAALSRGICGIAGNTLLMNFPGSEKAVGECFEAVRELLPHAVHLISEDVQLVQRTHAEVQGAITTSTTTTTQQRLHRDHVCPHKTGAGNDVDRNSPFPMLPVDQALSTIMSVVQRNNSICQQLESLLSPVNIPPFRASIKDGYAMKSTGFSGTKRVLDCIAAGDKVNPHPLQEDECFKINTGAPLPEHADCVVQVEDTKLLQRDKYGEESLVDILVEPKAGQDVRSIGYDLQKGDKVFPAFDASPVVTKSLLASVGCQMPLRKPKVAIISTGSELLAPNQPTAAGKIYDSNTTMLEELLLYFGFDCMQQHVLGDDLDSIEHTLSALFEAVDFVICSGGVSMGDKDYIKPVLQSLNFQLHFGRVNMKPGKPMTFASRENKYFFGLPGNPVSAFVTFHLFALPAIRWAAGWERAKCSLPVVNVTLLNDTIDLDARPEYVRASVTSIKGQLYASVNGDQISSRLQSIVGADVLIHLPGRSAEKHFVRTGDILSASVLRFDFISKYE
ncbi:molybdenum cofactor synthesis protein cinnamon [Drosophila innubila]|uniref:molybdenum cofactor synthesis protein cinnamon n=1 Tax=Drosophila innubila TaxID=198719 RepID=UPI00148CE5DE|nr:molybdenum cofactor synthesis protein cinnamon [Drosophila innubila]